MKIYISNQSIIRKTLQRKRRSWDFSREVDLGALLEEILMRANDLVPSESGSILLDDPTIKVKGPAEGKLYFLACFGEGSERLAGSSLPDNIGIVGRTYKSGISSLSKDVKKDCKFYPQIDKKTKFETKSIIAVPVEIESSVIGVIELINRKARKNYDNKDLSLLEIFAGYTSTLIQNALDARKFEDMSKRDNLTGLYNDRYFYDVLARCVKNASVENWDLSLIFFDLDHFKSVNDAHGHLAGSRVLQEVARLMEDVFTDNSNVMARYGGDEYVVILPDMGPEEAGEYAERFRKKVADNTFLKEPFNRDEAPLNIKGVISCSIGVASLAANVERVENLHEMEGNLIKAADRAMYMAKEQGKNRVVLAEGREGMTG